MVAARAGFLRRHGLTGRTVFPLAPARRVHPQSRDMSAQSTTKGAAAQPPARGFTEPDQVKRYADAKASGNKRVLDIDSVYNPAWMKGARVLVVPDPSPEGEWGVPSLVFIYLRIFIYMAVRYPT